jgi:hypothetical protein
MWNLIKDDPILKAIMVFVLGLFSFSFAFSIMFGSGQSGMEHSGSTGVINAANNMGQGGLEHGASSTGGSGAIYGLSQVISMLTRVFIIIILIALIIAAVKLIKKHVIGNEPISIEKIKDKPISIVFLGAAGILTVLYMAGIIMSGNVGNNMAYAGNASVLILAVRLVSAISVAGLIIGLAMYFKERYFTVSAQINAAVKENCLGCGHELRGSWKCCPICGNENNPGKVITNKDIKINSIDNEE